MIGAIVGAIVFYRYLGVLMIIDMSKLSRDELIKALGNAMKQISQLVEENNKLKEKLNENTRVFTEGY